MKTGQLCRIAVVFLLLASFGAFAEARPTKEPFVLVRVLKVYSSPGAWTGITEQMQWIDVAVEASTTSSVSRGDEIRIGVLLVNGSDLFRSDTAELDPNRIAVGKHLHINMSVRCAQRRSAGEYSVSPSCIAPVARSRK